MSTLSYSILLSKLYSSYSIKFYSYIMLSALRFLREAKINEHNISKSNDSGFANITWKSPSLYLTN